GSEPWGPPFESVSLNSTGLPGPQEVSARLVSVDVDEAPGVSTISCLLLLQQGEFAPRTTASSPAGPIHPCTVADPFDREIFVGVLVLQDVTVDRAPDGVLRKGSYVDCMRLPFHIASVDLCDREEVLQVSRSLDFAPPFPEQRLRIDGLRVGR